MVTEVQETYNGLQNIGFFHYIGIDAKLSIRDFCVFMYIVEKSVGSGKRFTQAKPMSWFHKDCGVGRRQWYEATKNLEEMGLIKRVGHESMLPHGGSTPFRYGPVFPDGIKIWLNDEVKNGD